MKLFHVTFRKTLPKIKKQGIRPQKFSIWTGAAGQHLGEFGRVYAFSNINDAMRWAFKQQWETKEPTVIVEFEDNNPGRWEPDTHWQACAAEGQWLKTFGAIKPEQLAAVHVVTPKDLKKLAKNPEDPDIRRNPSASWMQRENARVVRICRRENAKAVRKDPRLGLILERVHEIEPGSAVVRLGEALPEDVYGLLKKGREYNAGNAELIGMEPISCHANSARLYEERPENTTIVTGYGLGPDDDLWREHTWVWRDGRVIETTVLRNAYFGYPLTRKQAADFADANW